jgi:hypothetical protein
MIPPRFCLGVSRHGEVYHGYRSVTRAAAWFRIQGVKQPFGVIVRESGRSSIPETAEFT